MEKEELKRKALELFNANNSYGEIATQLNVGKTTVYNWINSGSEKLTPETASRSLGAVPAVLEQQQNATNDYNEQLMNEYGSENDINSLVALKKAELEHEYKMEKLELERERLVHERNLNSNEQIAGNISKQLDEVNLKLQKEKDKAAELAKSINSLSMENKRLSLKLHSAEHKLKNPDLDKLIYRDYLENVKLFLSLENTEIDCDTVEDVLDKVEITFTTLKNWIKSNNLEKSYYPEYSNLNNMYKSLVEMIEEFEESGEDELIFTFDSEFEVELRDSVES